MISRVRARASPVVSEAARPASWPLGVCTWGVFCPAVSFREACMASSATSVLLNLPLRRVPAGLFSVSINFCGRGRNDFLQPVPRGFQRVGIYYPECLAEG